MNYRTIQTMMLPGSADDNHDLFYQGTAGIEPDREGRGLVIPTGERVCFLTYFNGFFKKQWDDSTSIKDIRISIHAEGNCRFSFCHVTGKGQQMTDLAEEWDCALYGNTADYQIPEWNDRDCEICYFEAEGLKGGAILLDYEIKACSEQMQTVRPAVVICTYKREEDVRKNLSRLNTMSDGFCPAVFLIDNGNTLGQEDFPDFVRYVPNRNSGGTGGFTRGMLEVLEEATSDFTHVVLMDDDIRLETGVLERTWSFLSCLKEHAQYS